MKKIYKFDIIRCMSIITALCLIILQALPISAYAQNSGERKIIKAGFFAWEGYHIQSDNGVKSGYGYDFLKMSENYNNWKYEYVGYDKSWSDMLDMLNNGEIDMVTSAQKTPQWEEEFDYSQSSIGTSDTILTVRENDTRYIAGNTESYNDMKVALLSGSSRNDKFKEFAQEKGFTYIPVYYDSLEEMKKSLQNNEIDAVLSSNLRVQYGERILEEFDPVDFYAIVKKGNTELLDEINYAISQMDMNTPGWRMMLKNKYYTFSNGMIYLNGQETKYLEQCKAQGKVFAVVTNPDLAPYSWFENGEAKGIAPDIFRKIAEITGINYEFVPTSTYSQYNSYIRNGGGDIDLTCFSSYGLAEYHGLNISNSYMSTTLAMIKRESDNEQPKSMAELESSEYNTTYSSQLMSRLERNVYSTNAECVKAVINGDADCAYMYTYSAQKFVTEDVRNRLKYSIMPEYSLDMSIGVRDSIDYRLMSIINKGITATKGNYAQHIIQNEISSIKESPSLLASVYDNPLMALIIIAVSLAFIFLACLSAVHYRNHKRERGHAKEIARFMGYVCEANEAVMEINFKNMRCVEHCMEDGILTSREMSYHYKNADEYEKIIYPDDIIRLKEEMSVSTLKEIFRRKEKYTYFEARTKSNGDEYKWYAYTIRAVPKDLEHPDNFIMFKRNIDSVKKKEEEQKQILEDALENARSASSAKGQFLSRMSHEIRTPLNAIIGYMDMAQDRTDDAEGMMHCVSNSKIAARHLLSIINDVLDISSIENGKMKIAYEEFNLKEQLTTITTLFFHQSKEKGVRFDIKLENITEEWVIGDELRVNQILMNLLSNSVKFTDEGGSVELIVAQMKKTENKIFTRFVISDTGIGMSEEYQKKLFSPFEQESAQTAQKYGGTGLGLSITYNLVKMMGGSIDVKSVQGEGTSFTVSLYFGLSGKKHEEKKIQADYSKLRILIVDDDKGSCDYMKTLLKRCGVKCDTVESGKKALRQLKRRMGTEYEYDMCIIDWNMPEMDGLTLARNIRAEFGAEIPLIIATAYDTAEIEHLAKEAGVNKVMSKPLFQSTMFDLLVSSYGKYEPVSNADENENENLKELHILLAEDNEMNMEIAVNVLKKAGIAVDEAKNGAEAVDMFVQSQNGTYDAILMDIQMPVLDGYGAAKKIRVSKHPQSVDIPIIAMTANAFAEDVAKALASGMNDHVSKPIDHKKLFSVLSKIAGNKKGDKHE